MDIHVTCKPDPLTGYISGGALRTVGRANSFQLHALSNKKDHVTFSWTCTDSDENVVATHLSDIGVWNLTSHVLEYTSGGATENHFVCTVKIQDGNAAAVAEESCIPTCEESILATLGDTAAQISVGDEVTDWMGLRACVIQLGPQTAKSSLEQGWGPPGPLGLAIA
jgi:hypothetical protein